MDMWSHRRDPTRACRTSWESAPPESGERGGEHRSSPTHGKCPGGRQTGGQNRSVCACVSPGAPQPTAGWPRWSIPRLRPSVGKKEDIEGAHASALCHAPSSVQGAVVFRVQGVVFSDGRIILVPIVRSMLAFSWVTWGAWVRCCSRQRRSLPEGLETCKGHGGPWLLLYHHGPILVLYMMHRRDQGLDMLCKHSDLHMLVY